MQSVFESGMDKKNTRIALLVSCSCVMQIAESLIPNPFPGIRLGLANMLTIVALVDLGFIAAIQIVLLRTIASSFLLGTFLSPTFFLSFGGGLASACTMGLWLKLVHNPNRETPSLIGVSLVGAITHNTVQLLLVYLILIKHPSVFYIAPWLGISAVAMGWITGLVAAEVCRQIKYGRNSVFLHSAGMAQTPAFLSFSRAVGINPLSSMNASVKLIAVIGLIIGVLVIQDIRAYGLLFAGLLFLSRVFRIDCKPFIASLKRMGSLFLLSFIFPLLFSHGGVVYAHVGQITVSHNGILYAGVFTGRILLMTFLSYVLVRTTSLSDLAKALAYLLAPLKIINISGERIAAIIVLAWQELPDCWGLILGLVQNRLFKTREWNTFIADLGFCIVSLYQQTGADLRLPELKGV